MGSKLRSRMEVEDILQETFAVAYETIGGFVFSAMGKIPKPGEQCEHHNIGIQVIAAEPRRITRLRLNITPVAENGFDRD